MIVNREAAPAVLIKLLLSMFSLVLFVDFIGDAFFGGKYAHTILQN
jgi:hypothetical protein